MLAKIKANPGFILSFLTAFAIMLLYVYTANSTAENAKTQCERNKVHMQSMEKAQVAVATDVAVIKTKMIYIEDSIKRQTGIQEKTAGKVDKLSEMILKFVAEEKARWGLENKGG